MTLATKIEKMTVGEISVLSRGHKEFLFQESAVLAIHQSFRGNSNQANFLLKLIPLVKMKLGAKKALIEYFERWGNLYFNESLGTLKISKKYNASAWTNEYESEVSANPWTKLIEATTRHPTTVYDADKEFRKVVERLRKISEDPTKTLLHPILVSKAQEFLYAYGRTEEWTREDSKGRTLFDQSTMRSTMRASKFAKGT